MTTTGGVAVAWVHSTDVSYSFFTSMMNLQAAIMTSDRSGRWLGMRYGSGGIVDARNGAIARFLAGDDEWLLWIDTDMGFTADSLERLLNAANPTDRPVVGGLCFALRETAMDGFGGFETFPIPTVYRWAETPDGERGFVSWHEYPRNSLVRCDATGSAFILIHRSTFETIRAKVGDNWYTPIRNPNTGEMMGEDVSFCVRLMDAEIPLHVHTGIKTTHHKSVWVGESMFDHHAAAAVAAGSTSQIASVAPLNRAHRRRNARETAKG